MRTDTRGGRLAALFEERDLHILNDGSPTFVQSTLLSSCLDLTVASVSIARTSRWQVDADTMGSDHVPVLVNIRHSRTERRSARCVKPTDCASYRSALETDFADSMPMNERDFCQAVVRAAQSSTSVARIPEKVHCRRCGVREAARGTTRPSPEHCRNTRLRREVYRRLSTGTWSNWHRQPFRSLSLASKRQELEIAEEYCDHLASAPTNSLASSKDIPVVLESSSEPLLDIPFSLAELESALENAPVHTSRGADHVSCKALRNLPLCTRQSLLSIFQRVLGSRFRPDRMEICIGKTFERMVHSRLAWYLESTGFFPLVMAGFRQDRSAVDNVIAVTSSAQQARSEGLHTAAVFLDVPKAYDSVLHSTVGGTLQEAGVGGRMLS
ncbi:uncharacterized protein LOC135398696 [Ornithodoros turicata]|uniref:uncharacterized protein LOC135398696 n=1 Tax=Ornithodoros turicata TaxID=34597 RepID=UPI0031396DA2